jgi:hypothetical protein
MFLHHQPYCIMSWTVITVALPSRPERCYFRSAYIQSANNACFIELPSLQGYNVYISNCHYNVKSPLPVPILVTPQSHCRLHHGRISGEWEVVHVLKLRVVCLPGCAFTSHPLANGWTSRSSRSNSCHLQWVVPGSNHTLEIDILTEASLQSL